jgi:hypothetical protein
VSVETAIVAILKADATVLGLVASRIFPLKRPPRTTLPCIVFQKIDHVQEYHLRGKSASQEQRFQLNLYANTYTGARALEAAVESALNIYRGAISGTDIEHVELIDAADLDVLVADNEQQNEYARRQDYIFHIRS